MFGELQILIGSR